MMRLIDADALTIDLLKKAMDDAFLTGNAEMHRLLIQVIAHYPTVDAVPVRHGKWIRLGQKHDGGYLWIRCSVCGNEDIDSPVCMTKYCPHCGARMDADETD